MFNAIQFCEDHNIDYAKSGRYYRKGWTNIRCPFCKSSKHTLGIHHRNKRTTCYKCGGKNIHNVIWNLVGRPHHIIKKYTTEDTLDPEIKMSSVCQLPSCTSLTHKHSEYLIDRNFDPHEISFLYNVVSAKKQTDYYDRILIPIYYNGVIVSYQGRDVTNKSDLKYMACKEKDEVIKHKHILYNLDNCGDKVLVLEGVTDVWRIGNNSVATFGTGYTPYQVIILSKFKQVFIAFDSGAEAQEQADKLYYDLTCLGTSTEVIDINGDFSDPAKMSNKEAKYLKKTLDI